MNKQGQELTLSTIITAILVVIVLVLVVTFFLGGFAGLTSKVKDIFFGATAGTSQTLAVQNCRTYCDNAKLLPENLQKTSPWCTRKQKIDTNDDGTWEEGVDEEKGCAELGLSCTDVSC